MTKTNMVTTMMKFWEKALTSMMVCKLLKILNHILSDAGQAALSYGKGRAVGGAEKAAVAALPAG